MEMINEKKMFRIIYFFPIKFIFVEKYYERIKEDEVDL